MPVKKLVLIPAAKWDHWVKQYNLEPTSDIQDLTLPVPTLNDGEAPLAPPTPADALPPPDDAPKEEEDNPPGEGPGEGPDALPPGLDPPDALPGGPAAAAPPAAPGGLMSDRPGENMVTRSGMAYKCSDGKRPQLIKVPKRKKRRRSPRRRKDESDLRGKMDALREEQKAKHKEDSFVKGRPVGRKKRWQTVQKSVNKAVAARLAGKKKMQGKLQERTNELKSTRSLRHKKTPYDV